MKPALLRLDNYFVSELVFSANKSFRLAEPSTLPVSDLFVEPRCLLTEQGNWQVSLRIQYQPMPEVNFPYSFTLELVGFFETVEGLDSERAERIIKTNATSMLYGASREIIRAATSRGPYVAVILPSVSFYEAKPAVASNRDDANQEALKQVEKATDSEPVNGEELLESEELKRQLADAKKHLASESVPGTDH